MFPTHIKDYVKLVEGLAITTQDGATTPAITGDVIDREGFESAVINVQMLLTNAQDTKSVTVEYAVQVQDCDTSGGTYANYGDAQTVNITAETTDTTDVTVTDVAKLGINLRGAKRYIKLVVTPDDTVGTDNGATGDTEIVGVTLNLAGADELPTA